MNEEVMKDLIEQGNWVCWKQNYYRVIKNNLGDLLIKCLSKGHTNCICSTAEDEVNINPEDCYVLVREKKNND